MIFADDFDDVFRRMNRIFGGISTEPPSYVDLRNSERYIYDDYIGWTISVPELQEDEVSTEIHADTIIIHTHKFGEEDEVELMVPPSYKILPKETEIKYTNGILDIVAPIDKTTKDD